MIIDIPNSCRGCECETHTTRGFVCKSVGVITNEHTESRHPDCPLHIKLNMDEVFKIETDKCVFHVKFVNGELVSLSGRPKTNCDQK